MRIVVASPTTTPERLEEYARGFWRRGVPEMIRIWSVIDVKKVKTCRPTHGQRALYSGHKKIHCLKFQTLQAPDGLVLHCSYCADGRRGDGHILQVSGLIEWARSRIELLPYYIFGDSAYPLSDVIISMYRGTAATV